MALDSLSMDHIQDARDLGYSPREAEDGGLELQCTSLNTWLTPTAITTDLLRGLLNAAAPHLPSPATGAVVGVPARFDEQQCQATLQAAQAAGLHNVHLLREPIAAALACRLQHAESEAILVFDLGGGTFDLSLLESFEGVLEVLATTGDAHLGGNDFDAAIAKHVLRQRGLAPADISALQWQWLLEQSERAKRKGATDNLPEVDLSQLCPGAGCVSLSQGVIEDLVAPIMQRMWAPLIQLGKETCLDWHQGSSSLLCLAEIINLFQASNLGVSVVQLSSESETNDASSQVGLGAYTTAQHANPPAGLPASSLSPPHVSRPESYAPGPRRLGHVVLVGGGTRAPVVRSFVHSLTGLHPVKGVDPEAVVALGCAMFAGMLTGEVARCEMVDGAFSLDAHDRVTGF